MRETLTVWLTNLVFDTGRYVIFAIPAYVLVWHWYRERFRSRLIQRDFAPARHARRELRYAVTTALVFSLVGVGVWIGQQRGVLRIDDDPFARGVPYFFVTIVALIVLHDAYFYWTHRAMHHPRLFRHVHRVHHLSTNPSPLAAYAFAPLEALVHALYVPLLALVMPMSQVALFVFLVFMIARNVIAHLGVELLPSWFVRRRWSTHLTTTTHHAMHHQKPAGNYGLYFTFWDRLMGTTHADYEQVFERVTSRAG